MNRYNKEKRGIKMFLEISANVFPVLIAVLVILIPVLILTLVVLIKFIIKNVKKSKAYKNSNSFDYEELFGGKDNIINVNVNMTRVNLEVKDVDKVKIDTLKTLGIGVLIAGSTIKCSSEQLAKEVSSKIK